MQRQKQKKHLQKQKGQIFGIDAMIAFTIMLFCVLVFATSTANQSQKTQNNLLHYELEEKTFLIADSLVKNRDENNPLLGACIIDYDKKRVLTNQLDYTLLQNAKSAEFGDIYAKQITLEQNNNTQIIRLADKNSSECITAKRFAKISGEKTIIGVTICRE